MEEGKEILKSLIERLALTQDEEVDCEQVYRVLDVFTEAVARGEDPSEFLPLISHHVALCPDCREEYEALLKILRSKL